MDNTRLEVKLMEVLQERGMTLPELADKIGANENELRGFCEYNPDGELRFDVLDRICKTLHCHVDDIIGKVITN
jgi:DNA-binding Xre family transcriptional regulator